jgi:hypothetical protein
MPEPSAAALGREGVWIILCSLGQLAVAGRYTAWRACYVKQIWSVRGVHWGYTESTRQGQGGPRAPNFESRGRQKKIDGPPRAFAKYQTHPPTTRLFFPLTFFFSAFLGVSRQGEFKNTTKICLQKVHVEKKLKNFDVSFPSTFFVLSRLRVFFSDGSSKTQQKTFYKTNRVEKFFTKNSTKNPKPTFSRIFFITFLGVSR